MKLYLSAFFFAAVTLSGCSTYQAHRNSPTAYSPTVATSVQVLYSPPTRSYESIGIVSAKRYKPGWSDPTVNDAIPQLQAAGAELGANAVIVRSDRSNNDRHVVVEAEAIRYTDAQQSIQTPSQPTTQPASQPATQPAQGQMQWKPRDL